MKPKVLFFMMSFILLIPSVQADELLDDTAREKTEINTVQETSALPEAVPSTQPEALARWEYDPIIQISKWGQELRIIIEPNILMDKDKISTIDSVRLESEKGEFLGLKTFGAQEVKRRAEFMINPELFKQDNVKLSVVSRELGEWSKVIPLKETGVNAYTDDSAADESGDTPPAEIQKSDEGPKPKKKGWFW